MDRAGLAGREGAGDVGAGRRDAARGAGGGAAAARPLPHLQPQAQAEAVAGMSSSVELI